jgi:hypothetical protein
LRNGDLQWQDRVVKTLRYHSLENVFDPFPILITMKDFDLVANSLQAEAEIAQEFSWWSEAYAEELARHRKNFISLPCQC